MIYVIGSIILTSFLTLAFKVTGKYRIPSLQAIVFNYITCVIIGSIVNGGPPLGTATFSAPWFPWALLMGCFFISLFNVIAFTAQKLGVAVSSVANKLSLVIPFVVSIYLYGETATVFKIAGVLMALLAVVLTCWPHQDIKGSNLKPAHGLVLLVPAVLFFGSGILDAIVKFVEQSFLDASNSNAFFITAFAMAAVLGSILLSWMLATGRQVFEKKSILAGILIGIPNYFSIWCVVKALAMYRGNSSAVFPIINIGIVLFSTLVAFVVFREKLSKLNWAGIMLSVAAIYLMW